MESGDRCRIFGYDDFTDKIQISQGILIIRHYRFKNIKIQDPSGYVKRLIELTYYQLIIREDPWIFEYTYNSQNYPVTVNSNYLNIKLLLHTAK